MRERLERHAAENGRLIRLQIDGGVKVDNIASIATASAEAFVAGSAVFGRRDADGGYRGVLDTLCERGAPIARRE